MTPEQIGASAAAKIARGIAIVQHAGYAPEAELEAKQLLREGFDLVLDYEIRQVRAEMQKEIDRQNDEIARLMRELRQAGPKVFTLQ
jgi:hypothetical protein